MTCCFYFCRPCTPCSPCSPCYTPCCTPCYPCCRPCWPCCDSSPPKKVKISSFAGGGAPGADDDDDGGGGGGRTMKRPPGKPPKKKKPPEPPPCTPRALCNCPKPKPPSPCCCSKKGQSANAYQGLQGYGGGQAPNSGGQCRTCGMPKPSSVPAGQAMQTCGTCGMQKSTGLTTCGTCGCLKPANSMSPPPYQQFGAGQYPGLNQMPPMAQQMIPGGDAFAGGAMAGGPFMNQQYSPNQYQRPSTCPGSRGESKPKKDKHNRNLEAICLNNPLEMIMSI